MRPTRIAESTHGFCVIPNYLWHIIAHVFGNFHYADGGEIWLVQIVLGGALVGSLATLSVVSVGEVHYITALWDRQRFRRWSMHGSLFGMGKFQRRPVDLCGIPLSESTRILGQELCQCKFVLGGMVTLLLVVWTGRLVGQRRIQ
jgi:hypothetical protein